MAPLPPITVKRALLSVTDKTGLADFARALVELGVEVVSTGGTAQLLQREGVPVTPLDRFTGSPEMLDGRVKTLHPRVHGGILARRELASHRDEVARFGLDYIDLVAVNLYDFDGTVKKPGATFEDIVENIDIGGPTLLRAAAKNHASVIPVVRPTDYPRIIDALRSGRGLDERERRALALEVYRATARYDRAVSAWLESVVADGASAELPAVLERRWDKLQDLRYGENPHQAAAFYGDAGVVPSHLAAARQLQGKELSFNNLLDLDSALGLAVDLGATTAVFIKHNNPCGVATRPTLAEAIHVARACDPVSAFGAVIAVTGEVDARAAEVLTEAFIEAVIAPAYTAEALAVLAKKVNVRVLVLDRAEDWRGSTSPGWDLRPVRGGLLVQSKDARPRLADELDGAKVVSKRPPTDAERRALAFTWAVAKHVRSNAIVFGQEDRVVAVGAGQMSRVDSVKLCGLKAGAALKGTVVASDAFFPFRDGVDVLAEAGATAIVQPGGSIRDEEVIRAADEHGVAMMFTGVRHFRH
ncbi:bifunctional phosphoribosylaminoimidazolecarboxamide formyltransferase/IMP cyclohydrolase [Myxococcota bacterium]|nr:bifunctional phosphoribosylaminoimidazolecarboxamide formyltransferase/IMP cyclohydrolase [Myxococcota bacterium]